MENGALCGPIQENGNAWECRFMNHEQSSRKAPGTGVTDSLPFDGVSLAGMFKSSMKSKHLTWLSRETGQSGRARNPEYS